MTKEKFNIMKINNIDSKKNLSKFCQIFCRAKFLTKHCPIILTKVNINELTRFLSYLMKNSVKTKYTFLHILTKHKKQIINMLYIEKTKKHSVKTFSILHIKVVLSDKNGKIPPFLGKFSVDKMSLLNEKNLKIFA